MKSILVLLSYGADRNKTSAIGEKPIDLAKKEEIKQLLLGKNGSEILDFAVIHSFSTSSQIRSSVIIPMDAS